MVMEAVEPLALTLVAMEVLLEPLVHKEAVVVNVNQDHLDLQDHLVVMDVLALLAVLGTPDLLDVTAFSCLHHHQNHHARNVLQAPRDLLALLDQKACLDLKVKLENLDLTAVLARKDLLDLLEIKDLLANLETKDHLVIPERSSTELHQDRLVLLAPLDRKDLLDPLAKTVKLVPQVLKVHLVIRESLELTVPLVLLDPLDLVDLLVNLVLAIIVHLPVLAQDTMENNHLI